MAKTKFFTILCRVTECPIIFYHVNEHSINVKNYFCDRTRYSTMFHGGLTKSTERQVQAHRFQFLLLHSFTNFFALLVKMQFKLNCTVYRHDTLSGLYHRIQPRHERKGLWDLLLKIYAICCQVMSVLFHKHWDTDVCQGQHYIYHQESSSVMDYG